MIARTFFSKLAEYAPFAVLNNQLYQVCNSDSNGNFIKFNNHNHALVEASDFFELELLDKEINKHEIFEFKKKFIDERLKKEVRSAEDLGSQISQDKVLYFIVQELFPYFVEDDSKIEALLKGEEIDEEISKMAALEKILEDVELDRATSIQIEDLKDELLSELGKSSEKLYIGSKVKVVNSGVAYGFVSDGSWGYVQRIIGNKVSVQIQEVPADRYIGADSYEIKRRHLSLIPEELDEPDSDVLSLLKEFYREKGITTKKEIPKKIPIPKQSIALSEVLENNVFVFRGMVYKLLPGTNRDGLQVVMHKKSFSLEPLIEVSDAEQFYKDRLETQFKIEAVEEFEDQLKEIYKVRAKIKAIGTLGDKIQYEVGNVGFIKKQNSYMFYINVPKFAMKDLEEDIYYTFNSCKIAVELKLFNGEILCRSARIIGSYEHPFVSKRHLIDSDMEICMGYNHRSPGKTAEGIYSYLSQAVNVITDGFSEGITPYHKLTDHTHQMISLEDAKAKGYRITNIHKEYNYGN